MDKNSPYEIKVVDNFEQYATEFIGALRKGRILKDSIPDEEARYFLQNSDYKVIVLKDDVIISGFTLFHRSPHEVMWTDVFSIPGLSGDRLNILKKLFDKLCEILEDNNISWVVARPADQKLMRFYKIMGFVPLNEKLLGLPLGVLLPIYQITKEKFIYRFLKFTPPAKPIVEDDILKITEVLTLIRIDLKSGLTQYALKKEPDKWHDLERRCEREYSLCKNYYAQEKLSGPLTDLVFYPQIGHIFFPEIEVMLRSPWWTKESSDRITTPAHDADPFEITQEGDQIHVFKWDGYSASKMKPHRLIIERSKESYTFIFSSLSEHEYLRLYLEYREKPKFKDDSFYFGNLKFSFTPNHYDMTGYNAIDNFDFRTYLFFKTKEVKLTIEKVANL
jgi:hypothetical protein